MRLHVLEDWPNSGYPEYRKGEEIEPDEGRAAFLLRDAPSAFATDKPKAQNKATGAKEETPQEPPPAPEFDVKTATLEALQAFATEHEIDLAGAEGEDDIRAAIELWLEAQAKVETKETNAGTPANARPQRQSRKRG